MIPPPSSSPPPSSPSSPPSSPPKRVLLVTGSLGPGGTELAVVALARGLASGLARGPARGLAVEPASGGRFAPEVAVLGSAGALGAGLRELGVPVHELGITGPLRTPSWLARLLRLRRLARGALVLTFLFDADVYGMLAAWLGRPRAIVTTRRAIKAHRPDHLRGYRATNRFVDRIVANSEAVRRFTIEVERAPVAKVLAIPNGVDLARFAAGDGAAARRRLGLPDAAAPAGATLVGATPAGATPAGATPAGATLAGATPAGATLAGATLVGAIGTIKEVKGQRVLFEALAPLLAERPDLRLVLAGEVTAPYGESLRRAVTDAGLAGQVLFPGAIAEVPDLLAALDLFVLPSLSEGMSNALLEAMAAGKAIVATDVGGNSENLAAGAAGRLVPPRNADALRAAIVPLLDDAAERGRLAAAAHARANGEYALPVMLARYERLFDELAR